MLPRFNLTDSFLFDQTYAMMLLRSGRTKVCQLEHSSRKRRRALPYLPIDLQRRIFQHVDVALFQKGDTLLQRYMIQDDFLKEPHVCLAWAARQGRSLPVQMLLRAGVQLGEEAKTMAAKGGHMFKDRELNLDARTVLASKLLGEGNIISASSVIGSNFLALPDLTCRFAFIHRVYSSSNPLTFEEARALLKMWPKSQDSFVYYGSKEGIPWLLRLGLEHEGSTHLYGGVLWDALSGGHLECAAILIDSGTETFAASRGAAAGLEKVCARGYDETLLYVLKNADVGWGERDRMLEIAADAGKLSTIRILLEYGAKSPSAKYAAASNGHSEVYDMLAANGRKW